jgi:hypothetical protein
MGSRFCCIIWPIFQLVLFFRRLKVPFPGESEVVAMHLTVSVLAALILFSMPLQGASATEETVTVEENSS